MTWAAPWLTSKIKKCSEFVTESEQPETDGCCPVIPCSLCLQFDPDTGATVYGSAEFNGTAWTGEIAGVAFTGYWQRDQYTDECEFNVTLSGVVIYTRSCYQGADCKDPSDSVATTIGYATGTLTWTKVLQRPLALVTDYDTKRKRHFCGDCDCSCLTLCVTLTTPYCCTVKIRLTDTAYECDSPVWRGSGTCNGDLFEIELFLENSGGSYSGCSLAGTVNGVAVTTTELATCTGWTANLTLADGTTLQVVCDTCGCADEVCGTGCCWPYATNAIYPCGYLLPVDFEVSAPGCVGNIHGATGSFAPVGVPNTTYCGSCSVAPAVGIGAITGTRYTAGPGQYCVDTPCSIPVTLILECQDGATTGGMDNCCGGFRLWVGTPERFAGYTGAIPPGGSADLYWMEFAPSSCSCSPLAMIFDVTISADCPETWPDPGPCAGQPKNCCVPLCGGFTVTI